MNTGFTGSNNGGYFFGGDADYGKAPLSQVINGLTIGERYTLSFEWAQSQFTDYATETFSGWNVSFGDETVSTGTPTLSPRVFSGWNTFTQVFTGNVGSQIPVVPRGRGSFRGAAVRPVGWREPRTRQFGTGSCPCGPAAVLGGPKQPGGDSCLGVVVIRTLRPKVQRLLLMAGLRPTINPLGHADPDSSSNAVLRAQRPHE